jgi:hypothetical protein
MLPVCMLPALMYCTVVTLPANTATLTLLVLLVLSARLARLYAIEVAMQHI